MSAAALPRAVPRILLAITPPAMLIAASTNYDSLLQLGRAIHLGALDWTLPITVIGYEFASTAVYFLTPRGHRTLKRSAAFGAIFGLVLTIGLAALWLAIDDGLLAADFWLRLALKPIPSLVAAAFGHMLVLVWFSRQPAVVAAAEADEEARIAAELAAEDAAATAAMAAAEAHRKERQQAAEQWRQQRQQESAAAAPAAERPEAVAAAAAVLPPKAPERVAAPAAVLPIAAGSDKPGLDRQRQQEKAVADDARWDAFLADLAAEGGPLPVPAADVLPDEPPVLPPAPPRDVLPPVIAAAGARDRVEAVLPPKPRQQTVRQQTADAELPRVADKHVRQVAAVLEAAAAAGEDADVLTARVVAARLPYELKERTVRAALQVARHQMSQKELLPV
ncbi:MULTISPECIES: hypothetical protein [Streptosporangium]|uniref:DUF2637 domain-containing protein n=1 Tax=Streptosporangium brasiliense TaxID=47480 RepID=A0ABT9RM10_9ACTN|nr:hypothetical protein [Streptosporangium brasiliense]MDP9870339.1 hypothetical protein [Streptosporangium brasiliense]